MNSVVHKWYIHGLENFAVKLIGDSCDIEDWILSNENEKSTEILKIKNITYWEIHKIDEI